MAHISPALKDKKDFEIFVQRAGKKKARQKMERNMTRIYQDVLTDVNRGTSLNRAISDCGVVRSSFYKWRWIIEMLLVDPGHYSSLSLKLKTNELVAVCKEELLYGTSHQAALQKRLAGQLISF